jgi:sulfatase maturation enzyme AslB (radical SAM superfamily)
MERFPNTLILISTYRCNLRCGYCPVDQADDDMGEETGLLAFRHFIDNAAPPLKVRFFGGEPLLNMGLVRAVLRASDSLGAAAGRISFDLSTNGTLLDDETTALFASRDDFEMIVSMDGEPETHCSERHGDDFAWVKRLAAYIPRMRNISVNKVITPKNVGGLLGDFAFILKLGLTSINLLPAYYMPWPEGALSLLDAELGRVARLVRKLKRDGRNIRIKNIELRGNIPLFNSAMVVDTDGRIYSANHIMYRSLRNYRDEAVRTDVRSFRPETLLAGDERDAAFTREKVPREILEGTRAADAALTKFVNELMRFESGE